MIVVKETLNKKWNWWPLFPLYPYGKKKTILRELIPDQIWSLEQIQGLYYVAVPIRMTVIKVDNGLMLINPLPPTKELINELEKLITIHGNVKTIILPSASGLEHKIGLPALSRIFKNAEIWLCPGQWSFPINLPLDFLGIPSKRSKILFEEGTPHTNSFKWFSLGPLNLGLGRYQEISCYHYSTKTLHVTDAIVGIDSKPPEIFNFDPTPLLFHSRERGDEPLIDSIAQRKKGWRRLVLFSSFLKPGKLNIPTLKEIFKYSFKKDLRNWRSHFGIYPFLWDEDWESSLAEIMGEDIPKIQIAPVLQKLIFPRSKEVLVKWLENIKSLEDMEYLIPAHFTAPIKFKIEDCQKLINEINSPEWNKLPEDNKFLMGLYKKLYELKIIPEEVNL
ncbi:DUF4336 domain-containing protein [Prochlorococcus sp. MIT 0604]|uniref:DUF4336 domain-containing protein n=1 Tax=Prochlorococcus sp. MIT 0604 TaxID=1501268 RepID=UPI0005B3ECCC|nr:DUF4336 domain-containing protein [Prochlorococcus sp. MIT 0604]